MTDASNTSSSAPPSSSTASDGRPAAPIAIVGAGAVGTVLGKRLVDGGHRVAAVLSRTAASAEALAATLGAEVASTRAADLPAEVRVVFACVPDDAIETVAADLATADHAWAHTLVAHTSGARTAAALAPLADAGARTLSFHPMQTLTPDTPPSAFDGIVVGIEGDDAAIPVAQDLATAMGARPVVLSPEEKARYHCAAALASNGLVALMAAVREVLATTGIDDEDANALLRPLVERTWQNLVDGSPEAAITGPAARGDRGTIDDHLDGLADAAPHLVPLYAALTTEMIRVAVRSGALGSDGADAVLDALHTALDA